MDKKNRKKVKPKAKGLQLNKWQWVFIVHEPGKSDKIYVALHVH